MMHTQHPAPATPRTAPAMAAAVAVLAVAMLAGAGALVPASAAAQVTPPPGTSAQDLQRQAEALGLGGQLRDRLRNSGLTPAELRQQLASRGYDPSVLDPYLDEGVATPPAPGDDVLSALQALDIEFEPDTTRLGAVDSLRAAMRMREVMLPDSSAIEREHGLRVFGLETFARGTSEFEPMAMGPVPPGYMLGPGDQLTLILTGDVERAYTLPVTREGFIVIPQVGQVWVNGLTLEELRGRLFTALGQAYSGIGRGPEASTHFEVTLGRLRSNQLFITGEVVQPGSYIASPVASVLNALYQARGPKPNGSFRNVRVMRNGRPAAEVDLYAYLTRGDNVSDVTLQPGDVIFVPIHGPQVAVKGEVGRPAIYEMLPGENLLDLLQFAGGLTAPAAVRRARITRILPAGERTEPGVDRVVDEVDLSAVIRGEVPAPELRDGDELQVYRVRPELRRVVTVSGAVWKDCALEPRPDRSLPVPLPRDTVRGDTLAGDSAFVQMREEPRPTCTFPYAPGMRAWDAIQAAEGLKPDALRPRAHIARMDQTDSTVSVLSFSLETGPDGEPVDNPLLQEHDAIRVFSRTDFHDSLHVRISGEVREGPRREVRFREGLTLGDLLIEAGGLTSRADLVVEVTRLPDPTARDAGRMTETIRVPVDASYIVSEEGIRYYPGDRDNGRADDGVDAADEILLQPYDHVFVRRLPNLEDEDRTVRIRGEVRYPGSYMLSSKDERLSQVIERAGGLSNTAFPGGFRFYREGTLASVDLERVLERPGSRDDIVLLPGDSMVVPEYNPVVVVRGAVNSPAAVMYREGAGLGYYINNAGGYARHADKDAVHVRYANGMGAVADHMLLFRKAPHPEPGSTITVPLVPEDARFDLRELITDTAQIAATIGTALLVFTRF